MLNNKFIFIGVIFTLTILVVANYFSNHYKSETVKAQTHMLNNSNAKDKLLVDILILDIIKAVKNQYKLGKSTPIGFGVGNLEVFKRQENDNTQYDVFIDIEIYKKNKSGLKSWYKDTLEYSVNFDQGLKFELKNYQQNGWD
ncbi:hypothetical protein V1503_02570 [Bacillus sp. SCS-151]|uniref:hypothetical protein n=1 Tax=Nanhaiella sioensis TaxID=3115293 RepID=UPI00397D4C40